MNATFGIKVTMFRPVKEGDGYHKDVIGIINENGLLSATPFSLGQHGQLLHSWCNQPYSAKFWAMAGSYEAFVDYYKQRQLTKDISHTIYCINNKPIAFTEIYPIIGSELHVHIATATAADFGIHFLMAPPRQIAEELRAYKRSLSFLTLKAALDQGFKNGRIQNIYAEPDKGNYNACHLAHTVGFEFLKEVQLTDKVALLFRHGKQTH